MKTRIGDMLYTDRRSQWGLIKLYYIDFDKLTKFYPRKEKIYINDYDMLCSSSDRPFDEEIQRHYQEWVEETINRTLLGE